VLDIRDGPGPVVGRDGQRLLDAGGQGGRQRAGTGQFEESATIDTGHALTPVGLWLGECLRTALPGRAWIGRAP